MLAGMGGGMTRWYALTALFEIGSFLRITGRRSVEHITVYIFQHYTEGGIILTHWKKLTNPNYLGSYAFQPGEEKALTIASVGQEMVTNPAEPDKKENCIVAHFQQPEKPLILNKTNCKTIEKLTGTPDIEQWPGAGIILCVQRVNAFGELVEAVRIRPVKPYICSDCGGIITGYKDRSHAEIREHTRKEYGRQLCAVCATKAAEARRRNEPAEAESEPAETRPHRRRRTAAAES